MQPVIYESEYNFCKILWENEPVKSTELVRLCREKLDWKKSTTYTVIKRLSDRGIIKSENAIVTSIIKMDTQHQQLHIYSIIQLTQHMVRVIMMDMSDLILALMNGEILITG